MRISHGLVPPGGWKYLETDNIWLQGQTWDELVENVGFHRVSNGMKVGNVAEDVDDQIAENFPEYQIGAGLKLKKKPMGVSFFHTVQSFAQFLLNWTLSGGGLVDQNTANLRAATCMTCHNNLSSSEVKVGCSTCNKGANKLLDLTRDKIIKNNKTTYDGRLLTCGICGCDLKISVWMPNKALLSSEDANAYPSFCWKKKILEDAGL